jgi:flavodoxin
MKEKLTKLEEPKKDPSKYDIVIIGTPVWGGKMSVPVRTYIHLEKDGFKKIAFFCTAGGQNNNIFPDMGKICGKAPVATLELSTKEVKKNENPEKIKEFSEKLKG